MLASEGPGTNQFRKDIQEFGMSYFNDHITDVELRNVRNKSVLVIPFISRFNFLRTLLINFEHLIKRLILYF